MKRSNKEIFKMYRGVGIIKNSVYTNNDLFNKRSDLKSLKVMLMTPDIERYFNTIGQARSYVDAHFEEIQKELNSPWPEISNSEIIYDDIPF